MSNLAMLSLKDALEVKWERGRQHYGDTFVGDPVEELYEELLDGINYAGEAERQGIALGPLREDLAIMARRVRMILIGRALNKSLAEGTIQLQRGSHA